MAERKCYHHTTIARQLLPTHALDGKAWYAQPVDAAARAKIGTPGKKNTRRQKEEQERMMARETGRRLKRRLSMNVNDEDKMKP